MVGEGQHRAQLRIAPPASRPRDRIGLLVFQHHASLWMPGMLAQILTAAASSGGLRVIGAGQGRTGTESLRLALNSLDVGPTYHMSQLLGIDASRPVSPLEMLGLSQGHCDLWSKVEADASSGGTPDFSFLIEHYNSSIDYPSAAYFAELLKANPKTKVILTVRDAAAVYRSSRDSWCRLIGIGSPIDALVGTIYSMRPYGRRFFRMHGDMGRATGRALGRPDFSFRDVCSDPAYGTAFFDEWNAMVKRTVPAHKLLVFETGKHGYKELSRFLGVKEPSSPYPRTNSAADFAFVLNIMRMLALITVTLPALLVWCVCTRGNGAAKPKRS